MVNNALTSPGFPTQYPNNMHCVQRFHSIRKGAEDQFFNFFSGTRGYMRVSNLTIDSFRVTFTANGKRQIQVELISKLKKIAGIKTAQTNSYG